MQYLTPNPFRTGYDFHNSTHNHNALNTLVQKVPGGRAGGNHHYLAEIPARLSVCLHKLSKHFPAGTNTLLGQARKRFIDQVEP
jgi:hypothetical protein